MKLKIFFCFLFFCLNANSQTPTISLSDSSSKIGLSEEEFIYACDEYKKMMVTDAYLDLEKITRLNADKMREALSSLDHKNLPLDSLKTNSLYLKWIEKNIKKTQFKSIEDAKNAIGEQITRREKLEKENPKLFKLIDRSTVEQRQDILKPFFDRARKLMGH